ncbi:hypothetical protein GKZ90_0012265 [Flavobacterium sp. MC2016-06]|jgi:hypothetical protein|uniref:hypothetical protein n=1 Tax=Flavobacterium sp. MC2016-06 TaxID=2676308 RepID=UPI0012BB04F3|nr:hypothetical protein [Flavobacterium sp. MC2016-06]MBU3862051.1 hypothetical protein [Flavobacterium sp. MC2016-06]
MYSRNSRITSKWVYNFIVFTILIGSIRLWSFVYIPDRVFDFFEFAIVFITIFLLANKWSKLKRKDLLFRKNVKYFILIPLISSFGAYFYHKQEFYWSLIELRIIFFWLFYFLLHAYDISESKIIKLTVKIGVIWALINIIQQFTFPFYLFRIDAGAGGEDSIDAFIREGLLRFRISGQQYGMFLVFFSFYHFLKTRKKILILYVIIGLLGFYYYGTRQFLFGILIGLVICAFLVRGSSFHFSLLFLLIGGGLLIYNMDLLFGSLIKKSNEQLSSEDYIRFLSADFYLNQFWPKDDWFSRFIGNGQSQNLSLYGKEMNSINSDLKFFSSDVGIIGGYSKFGVFYVANVLWSNLKGIFYTYKLQSRRYLILFFVYALMLLLLSEYYANAAVIPFYCIIFYLVDKANEQAKSKI